MDELEELSLELERKQRIKRVSFIIGYYITIIICLSIIWLIPAIVLRILASLFIVIAGSAKNVTITYEQKQKSDQDL